MLSEYFGILRDGGLNPASDFARRLLREAHVATVPGGGLWNHRSHPGFLCHVDEGTGSRAGADAQIPGGIAVATIPLQQHTYQVVDSFPTGNSLKGLILYDGRGSMSVQIVSDPPDFDCENAPSWGEEHERKLVWQRLPQQ